MVKTVPTIRAANLVPVVRWIEANRMSAADGLDEVNLGYWFNLAPTDPVPLLDAVEFLKNAARRHGPDLPCRVVDSASVGELAYIGQVALGARTAREAITRVSASLPMHSSHEDIQVAPSGPDLVVTESWRCQMDAEGLHLIHCLLASMLQQICLFSSIKPPVLQSVTMTAHPRFGIDHLKPWFGNQIVTASAPRFTAVISGDVADRSFRTVARSRLEQLMRMNIAPLAEDRSLAGSIRPVLASMLHGGEPSIDSIARSAGMSVRTLQRRLSEEGTSFSAELERVRSRLARKMLMESDASIPDVSERLGYSSQSSLTRAVRRMTGRTPARIGQSANA